MGRTFFKKVFPENSVELTLKIGIALIQNSLEFTFQFSS